jgi:hypothetical protein
MVEKAAIDQSVYDGECLEGKGSNYAEYHTAGMYRIRMYR